MERVLAIRAVAEMQETDGVLLRKGHELLPSQGVTMLTGKRLFDHAVAGGIRHHFQRPCIRHEANLAKLLLWKPGNAGFPFIQNERTVEWSQILQPGDCLLQLR